MTECTVVWDDIESGSREVTLLVNSGWKLEASTIYYSPKDDEVMLVSMLTRTI